MPRDLLFGSPVVQPVTVLAVAAQLTAMGVLVTADAALPRKLSNRSAIIVASQTLGRAMRA